MNLLRFFSLCVAVPSFFSLAYRMLFVYFWNFDNNSQFVYFDGFSKHCRERNEKVKNFFPRPLLSTIHFAHTIPYTVLLFLATLPKVRRKKELIVPRKLAIDLTFNTRSSAKWRLLK